MHFNRYILKIIFSKKQLVIFIIMFISTCIVMLFFLFFKTFTKYYIEELKLIYPSVYLFKDKPIEYYQFSDIEVKSEIFELNIDNFSVSFNKSESYTLGSLGLRSFHKMHIPKSLENIYEHGNILYVSQKLYTQLQENKNFNGSLYLESDINSKVYLFNVKTFALYDDSKWILLEHSSAKKLYREEFFNKASFYTSKDEKELKVFLKSKFNKMIYSWEEHISLVSRAIKESMLKFFSMITIAIALLSISSIIFFTRELADDLLHLTKHAFFYAISLRYVFLSYFFISNIILLLIIVSAYFLAFFINDFITQMLWGVDSYDEVFFLIYILGLSSSIATVLLYFGLKRLYYSKTYGLPHV